MKIIVLFLSFFLCTRVFSQKNDLAYFAVNAFSGGLTSGVVACFHKPNHGEWGKVFINAFWKGCTGGSVCYAGKKMIEYSGERNTYAFVWPARIIHSVGSSMVLNGSMNRDLLSSLSLDLFFVNLEIEGKTFHPRIDLLTFGTSAWFLFQRGYSFNPLNSLATGSMFFDKKSDDHVYDIGEDFGLKGMSLGNTIWRKKIRQYYYNTTITSDQNRDAVSYNVERTIRTFDRTIALHEVVHTFQYSEQAALNLDVFRNMKYVTLNPSFPGTYTLNSFISNYSDIFFEQESRHFSSEIDYTHNWEIHEWVK